MKYEYERESEASATTKLAYLLIGGSIGAALALLFAPKSGQELRGEYCRRNTQRCRKRQGNRRTGR